MNVFGTDETEAAQIIPGIRAFLKNVAAQRLKRDRVVPGDDFLLVRNQIIVKLPHRAVVQAAAVRQQIAFFAVCQAPFPQTGQRSPVPVFFTLKVE